MYEFFGFGSNLASSSSSSSSSSSNEGVKKKKRVSFSSSSSSFSKSYSTSDDTSSSSSSSYSSDEDKKKKKTKKTKKKSHRKKKVLTPINPSFISIASTQFNIKSTSIRELYDLFFQIPYNETERTQLFCGIPFMNINHHKYDDGEHECSFYNKFHPHYESEKIGEDVFKVDYKKHCLYYYIIAHALIDRIVNIVHQSKKFPFDDAIDILQKNYQSLVFNFSTSDQTCISCYKGEHTRECMNYYVIYTKKTSPFFVNIQETLSKGTNCIIHQPLPFQLVLFLCGNTPSFRNQSNIKNFYDLPNECEERTNYIDYDKWVCLPSFCVLLNKGI